MGTDIYIIREARVDGKWQSCEKSMKQWYDEHEFAYEHHMHENASADLDVGRPSQVMGILTGDAYMTVHEMDSWKLGIPEDASEETRIRLEDESKRRDEWLIENKFELTPNNQKQYYYCTFKDMVDYLDYWRNDMQETGCYPVDLLDEDGDEKLYRFENGIYKNDIDKKMQLMLKVFDDPNCNPLQWFLKILNETKCEGKFSGNLKDVKDEDKRIIFWYSY